MFQLIATCPEESKDVLANELTLLGAASVEAGYRAIYFNADLETFFRIHLRTATASRILLVIKEVPAKTPEILKFQAARVRWPEWFTVERTYLVEGIQTERGSHHMTSNDISKMVRLGIEDSFLHRNNRRPRVDLLEPKVRVVAFQRHGRCMLSFDTCGKALHKRGYRGKGHPAPVKETLAATLLKLADYDPSKPLLDPMGGSGTIAIEAAYQALNKAPQIHRKKGQFAFEWLKLFDSALWRQVQDEIRMDNLLDLPGPIFYRDLEPRYVDQARVNALKARVERHIDFACGSFFELEAPAGDGLLVTNLPYGERIDQRIDRGTDQTKSNEQIDQSFEQFFKCIGDTLKTKYQGWTAALLVAESSPYKLIGLKPRRKFKLSNGNIPCRLLIFDLYSGSRRRPHSGAQGTLPK